MSIEKFTGSFEKEESGCTIIINQTIQSIKDCAVLGVYVHLLSRPPGWNINAKNLIDHFGSSKKKIYGILNKLIEMRLLHRWQSKENGKFKKYHYTLFLKPYDQLEFLPRPLFADTVNGDTYKTKKDLQNKDNTISVPSETLAVVPKKVTEEKIKPEQIADVYHETLPDSPKIKVIDDKLANQLKAMVNKWPKYSSEGKAFSLESFKNYLLAIKSSQPKFLEEYRTKEGGKRKNNLRTLTRDKNICQLLNNEFSF
jgi:hypothetical protein